LCQSIIPTSDSWMASARRLHSSKANGRKNMPN
jgi:hypothetical protein